MVNVVNGSLTQTKAKKIANGLHQIFRLKYAGIAVLVLRQLLLDFVTADTTQVIAAVVKENTLQKLTRIGNGRRIAGTQLLINILECFLFVFGGI